VLSPLLVGGSIPGLLEQVDELGCAFDLAERSMGGVSLVVDFGLKVALLQFFVLL
jgi:hypothetical protein